MATAWYIMLGGFLTFFVVAAWEYGWPPVGMLEGWLRTEKSRRIAVAVCWVLTAGFLVSAVLTAWNAARDLFAGI